MEKLLPNSIVTGIKQGVVHVSFGHHHRNNGRWTNGGVFASSHEKVNNLAKETAVQAILKRFFFLNFEMI